MIRRQTYLLDKKNCSRLILFIHGDKSVVYICACACFGHSMLFHGPNAQKVQKIIYEISYAEPAGASLVVLLLLLPNVHLEITHTLAFCSLT